MSAELTETLVYAFPKNGSSEYRSQLRTWHGHRLASIQLYVTNRNGELVPTAKAVTVRAKDQLADLRAAVDALIEEYEREQDRS
jgi:hypothetical protein